MNKNLKKAALSIAIFALKKAIGDNSFKKKNSSRPKIVFRIFRFWSCFNPQKAAKTRFLVRPTLPAAEFRWSARNSANCRKISKSAISWILDGMALENEMLLLTRIALFWKWRMREFWIKMPYYLKNGKFSRDFQELSYFFYKSLQNKSLPLNYIKRVLFAFLNPRITRDGFSLLIASEIKLR